MIYKYIYIAILYNIILDTYRRMNWSLTRKVLPNRRYGFKWLNPKLLMLGISKKTTNFEPMAMFHQSKCLVNMKSSLQFRNVALQKTKENKMIVIYCNGSTFILLQNKDFRKYLQKSYWILRNSEGRCTTSQKTEVPRNAVAGVELWPIGHSKGQVNSGATWQAWRLTGVVFWWNY